jgi:hypothetical protein
MMMDEIMLEKKFGCFSLKYRVSKYLINLIDRHVSTKIVRSIMKKFRILKEMLPKTRLIAVKAIIETHEITLI